MKSRLRATWGPAGIAAVAIAIVFTGISLNPIPAEAQARRKTPPAKKVQAPEAKAPAPAPATGWTKKTPDGLPDLQGFWSTTSNVPLERPASCGTREIYTDEEMKAGARNCIPTTPAPATDAAPDAHSELAQFGLHPRTVAESNRTSMIVGPEGRIPPLSSEGQKRQADLAAKTEAMQGHEFDQAENRSLTERCLLWSTEGPPVLSPGYNSILQIVQGQGYVMILQEMMHDARMIPTDNRPHLDSRVGQWFGDSRGYWEGDTLVVETTNYNGRNPFQKISSEELKVTERFKRIDEATLQYEFTIDDPVWTNPWTAVVRWARTEGPLFEYACHEENQGIVNILNTARVQEKEAAEAAAKGK
jgi:hypothetical protein